MTDDPDKLREAIKRMREFMMPTLADVVLRDVVCDAAESTLPDHDKLHNILGRIEAAAKKIPGPEFHVISDALAEMGSALVDLSFLVAKR